MFYRLIFLIILSISQYAYAAHWVRSYVRSNGTFVAAHISGDPGEGAYGHWHHNVYYPNTYARTTHNTSLAAYNYNESNNTQTNKTPKLQINENELINIILEARAGNAAAQTAYGVLYANGQGVKQDYTQAAHWFQKAADQGYSQAQYNLGVLYDKGQGVHQDYTQAKYWYQKAADQGVAQAQYNLGVLYDRGQGVTQSYKKARHWFQRAVDQNCYPAKVFLGFLDTKGLGYP